MESDRERLNCWLENIEMVLRATEMSPVYIPTVNEEWIKAAKQKPTPVLENPKEPPPQPNKPTGPKPARKHVAKKSGGRQKKIRVTIKRMSHNSQDTQEINLRM